MDVKKRRIKRGIVPILVVLLLFMVVAGFVIADQNTQRVQFGNEQPLLAFYTEPDNCYQLRLNFGGKQSVLDFTEEYLTLKNVGVGIHQIVNSIVGFR